MIRRILSTFMAAVLLAGGESRAQAPISLADLKENAATALPEAAALMLELARPADRVVLREGGSLLVKPLFFPLPDQDAKESLSFESLDKPGESRTIPRKDIEAVDWYEATALQRIEAYLGGGKKGEEEQRQHEAEMMLRGVLFASRSLRDRSAPGGDPWAKPERNLLERLEKVRAALVDSALPRVGDEGAWKKTLVRTEEWLGAYPSGSLLHRAVEKAWGRRLAALTARKEWRAARDWLDRCDAIFPDGPSTAPGREELRRHALDLVKKSQGLSAAAGLVLSKEAYAAWPALPDLADEIARRQGSYRVLKVGVGTLPKRFSPGAAVTDSERLLVPLLFEELARRRSDSGQGYQAVLAEELPSSGTTRQTWVVRRDGYFADGRRVTARDVRHSWRLLTLPEAARRDPLWADLLAPPRLESDSFRLGLELDQGLLDPLGPATFPIVPETFAGKPLVRADDAAFAVEPVGSGPFRVVAAKEDEVVLRRNPHHRHRPPLARPQVREIRIRAWSEPEIAGKDGAQVLADVPDSMLPDLRKKGYEIRSVLPPRVHFLAVNGRRPDLADLDLRRALGHALNRKAILDAVYGEGDGKSGSAIHRPASGLFPPGSWAACPPPRVPEDPYDPDRARSSAKKAVGERKTIRFGLKYPAEDKQAAAACKEMAAAWRKLFAEVGCTLTVDLQGGPAAKLRSQVFDHDYDLAWWDMEFTDGNYWIWPLFDPRPTALDRGGSNILGYQGDAKLQALLVAARAHRAYGAAREQHHNLHAYLLDRMPVVPLWQLQRHFAFLPSVRPGTLNAHAPLADAAGWSVD